MKIFTLLIFVIAKSCSNPVPFHSFSSSNNKFAASVYKEVVTETKGNFLMSPLSAQLILALSQAGAKDETASEIQKALKLPLNKQLIDCVIVDLLQNLNQEHDYVLKTANKVYVRNDSFLREEFAATAKEVYGAEAENVDFDSKVEAAALINRWVEDNTEDTIHNLIDPEILGNETSAVLVNALRFRGNWSIPFQFFSTMKQDFHTFGSTIKVDIMHIADERLQYYEKPELKATFLELPIVGDNISMTIVLPKDLDGLPRLEDRIGEVLEAPKLKYQELFDVSLPKFKLESRIDLKKILQKLGVKRAFQEGIADFSLMAGEKGELFIDDVVQKTFMDVNEDGIEAAAATFVVKILNRHSETPRDFKVDHPFLFFVKVEEIVVFVGRVIVPYY